MLPHGFLRITANTGTSFDILDREGANLIIEKLVTGKATGEKTIISLEELVLQAPSPPPIDFIGVWPTAIKSNITKSVTSATEAAVQDEEFDSAVCLKSVMDYFAGKDELPQANKEANKDSDPGVFNQTEGNNCNDTSKEFNDGKVCI